MRKMLFVICISMFSSVVFANGKVTYLSCPKFDERAPDLIVVLDQANGTASLQTPSMGNGLNFTSTAAFGPTEVTWRKDSPSLKQTYSVDRSSLILKRKTYSETTSNTYTDSSSCTISRPPKKNKF